MKSKSICRSGWITILVFALAQKHFKYYHSLFFTDKCKAGRVIENVKFHNTTNSCTFAANVNLKLF